MSININPKKVATSNFCISSPAISSLPLIFIFLLLLLINMKLVFIELIVIVINCHWKTEWLLSLLSHIIEHNPIQWYVTAVKAFTQSCIIFSKLAKTRFCTCHLHLQFTRLCVSSVMQERYHCKGEEFSFNYMLHINCQNKWAWNMAPLKLDYLYFDTHCIYIHSL